MKARIKINKSLRGFAPGQTTMIEVNEEGIPVDIFWRKRLKDSKFDKCIEFVDGEPKEKPKKSKPAKPAKPAAGSESENTETSGDLNNADD